MTKKEYFWESFCGSFGTAIILGSVIFIIACLVIAIGNFIFNTQLNLHWINGYHLVGYIVVIYLISWRIMYVIYKYEHMTRE